MAPGFLAVLSEPGDQVSVDEFHDWYDNEHIPLRLNYLPSFLSGARYQSIDGNNNIKQPSWIAVYEIDDTKTFNDPSYTVLRETRSRREEDIIGRLGVLDRRTCEVVKEVGEDADSSKRTTGLKVGNPSRWVVTHGVGKAVGGINADEDEESKEVGKWLDEVVTKLYSVEGWVKTRVLKVLESAKTGTNVGEEESVLSYFVFHGKSPYTLSVDFYLFFFWVGQNSSQKKAPTHLSSEKLLRKISRRLFKFQSLGNGNCINRILV